jgi:hypothetical protein
MNEHLLREQIVELTKLLELKDLRIKELEALRSIPSLILNTEPKKELNFCQNKKCKCGKREE